MNRALKTLAILVLIVTVLGAGVVLYAQMTLAPQVLGVVVTQTPAVDVQDTFDAVVGQTVNGTFAGRQYADAQSLSAQESTFITYTVRLENRGFFPAEWISLRVTPESSADGFDVLQMPDDRAYVLAAGAMGDMNATILRAGDAGSTARQLIVTCYVFGQKVEFAVAAQ